MTQTKEQQLAKKTLSILDGLKAVEDAGKKQTADARMVRTVELGDMIRQGDVSLYPIDEPSKEEREKFLPWPHAVNQLAIGDTPGSKHTMERTAKVALYHYDDRKLSPRMLLPNECEITRTIPADCVGPVMFLEERAILTHLEHAHVSLPKGWYRVMYQIDDATMEATRVWD